MPAIIVLYCSHQETDGFWPKGSRQQIEVEGQSVSRLRIALNSSILGNVRAEKRLADGIEEVSVFLCVIFPTQCFRHTGHQVCRVGKKLSRDDFQRYCPFVARPIVTSKNRIAV